MSFDLLFKYVFTFYIFEKFHRISKKFCFFICEKIILQKKVIIMNALFDEEECEIQDHDIEKQTLKKSNSTVNLSIELPILKTQSSLKKSKSEANAVAEKKKKKKKKKSFLYLQQQPNKETETMKQEEELKKKESLKKNKKPSFQINSLLYNGYSFDDDKNKMNGNSNLMIAFEFEKPIDLMVEQKIPFEDEFLAYFAHLNQNSNVQKLYNHQIQAIRWIYWLEHEKFEKKYSDHTGGILGDDMGMGKTMVGLCKLLYDNFMFEKHKEHFMNKYYGSYIVITTLTLLNHWETEAKSKIKLQDSDILIFRGPNRETLLQKCIKQSKIPKLIITTYETLQKDSSRISTSHLFKIKVKSVISDEAHIARNGKTKTTHALKILKPASFLCFTGTAFINSENDIFTLSSLCTPHFPLSKREINYGRQDVNFWKSKYFLARKKTLIADLPPKTSKDIWTSFDEKDKNVYQKLEEEARQEFYKVMQEAEMNFKKKNGIYQKILLIIMKLRQKTEHPIIYQQHFVTGNILKNTISKYNANTYLDEVYKQRKVEVEQRRKERLFQQKKLIPSKKKAISLDIELSSDDEEESFIKQTFENEDAEEEESEEEDQEYVLDLNSEESKILHLVEDDEILEMDDDENVKDKVNPELVMDKVINMIKCTEVEKKYLATLTIDDISESPKQKEIINLIQLEKSRDKEVKIVIISQFTTMLDVIQSTLIKNGYNTIRFDGLQQNPDVRRIIIQKFINEPQIDILLTSLHAGGVGLNFVPASVLILVDPWWNLALENQAIDRVHRIGQKKHVHTYRLLVEDSIEKGVLDIQEQKNSEQDDFFKGNTLSFKKFNNNFNIEDFEQLFKKE